MGQEFVIKSQQIEDKVNQLLPSQGGFQPGVDFSASTTIIPIVDLTETAEGSSLRQDLQSSISFKAATAFSVANTTSTIVNTTGYWRIIGTCSITANGSGSENASIILNDGASTKTIWEAFTVANANAPNSMLNIDFIIYLEAGHSLQMASSNTEAFLIGSVRQIADINGNLVNP